MLLFDDYDASRSDDTEAVQPEEPLFSDELFADLHYSPPSTPSQRRKFQEYAKLYPENEFYRALYEADVQKCNRLQKEAEALGFSSWDEKERHQDGEQREWLEDYIKEHGHSPPPPILSEEQKAALELQYQRTVEVERVPCNCEVHFHPGFCPQRLRDYKSQGVDPDDFAFLQSLHPTDLNICIHEDDPSKRIPDCWLERFWDLPSQHGILRLPLWAKRDDIVQRIIDDEEVDQTIYHGDYDQKRHVAPPPRIVSLSPEISEEEEKAKSLEDFELHCRRGRKRKREKSTARLDLEEGSPRGSAGVENDPASPLVEPTTDQKVFAKDPLHQRTGRGRSRTVSALEVDKTKRTLRLQVPGTKKRSRSLE